MTLVKWFMRSNKKSLTPQQKLSQLWLAKANDDLLWAKATVKDKFYSSACFVSQQVAEKVLKAFLIFCGHRLIKTQLLPMLLEAAGQYDKNFIQ